MQPVSCTTGVLHDLHWFESAAQTRRSREKASVTILADFGPEFNPPFRWRSKYQTKITKHIINLVYSEFPNRSCRSVRSFISTLKLYLRNKGSFL